MNMPTKIQYLRCGCIHELRIYWCGDDGNINTEINWRNVGALSHWPSRIQFSYSFRILCLPRIPERRLMQHLRPMWHAEPLAVVMAEIGSLLRKLLGGPDGELTSLYFLNLIFQLLVLLFKILDINILNAGWGGIRIERIVVG